MKKSFVLLLTAVCLVGCVRYDVSMNNGTKLTNVRKPVLDKEKGVYTITSATGKKYRYSSSRITLIEPHQKEKFKQKGDTSQFLTQ